MRKRNEEIFSFTFFFLPQSSVHAGQWFRLGAGAQPVTQDAGDVGTAFSVSVGTTTPVKVYTQSYIDREILFQNTDSTFYVHCSTWSAFTATSGTPRFLLPPKPTGVTTNATFSIWCLADPSAGSSTIEIVGVREKNSKD